MGIGNLGLKCQSGSELGRPAAILGVETGCRDSKVLSRAYKRLALKWHPDKNVDNIEEASRQFDLVRKAFDVLSDPEKHEKYEKVHRAKAAAAERHERLTGKRKRMKEELLKREHEAAALTAAGLKARKTKGDPARKKQTISDLRKAGEAQRRAMDAMRCVQRNLAGEGDIGDAAHVTAVQNSASLTGLKEGKDLQTHHVVSIKWKRKQGPQHSAESLKALLVGKCNCQVDNILMGRKGNRAIAEFRAPSTFIQKMINASKSWGLTMTLKSSHKKPSRGRELSKYKQ